jgi:CheY-like chemotaxis protein
VEDKLLLPSQEVELKCPVDGMKIVRVWIVEDNSADAFLIELALRRTGLLVEKLVMSDGEAAIRNVRACQAGSIPPPDILILDLNLPRFDGMEILRALRETPLFDGVGIAVFSSAEVVTAGLGVKRHLQKPSNLEGFLTEVSRAVLEILPDKKSE